MLLVNLNQDKSNINKYLSNTLLKCINDNIEKWKKSIIYLNKRWEYSSLVCTKCNNLFKCPNCDISLSIHNNEMICHTCNFMKRIENKCSICNSSELFKVWIWTQQIENTLKDIYKDVRIFRIDTDIVKNKSDKEKALENLKKAEIIIWTKMITTWFDFESVGLVGVILIEQELQIPKYNTEEKVYSNIKQLLWRWWRKWEETNFIIQTFIPENEIIQNIINKNYKDFFIKTLEERKLFKYPPFTELATIEYRDLDKDKSKKFIDKIFKKLEINNADGKIEIIQIEKYTRKHNQYYYKIIIKWDNLRSFLECIKKDIFTNSKLVTIFE